MTSYRVRVNLLKYFPCCTFSVVPAHSSHNQLTLKSCSLPSLSSLNISIATGTVQGTQVYRVYPLIFQSALSKPTFKSPLIPSVANQLLQETVYKGTTGPWTTCKVFFSYVDGLRNKEWFTQNTFLCNCLTL